mmetsp:Transcript_22172/g.59347  ORF Transcript_22172/g.59347 Transcript_22172/m.59347 type:complete len:215 (+) Transcript_22172:707-1351(+)
MSSWPPSLNLNDGNSVKLVQSNHGSRVTETKSLTVCPGIAMSDVPLSSNAPHPSLQPSFQPSYFLFVDAGSCANLGSVILTLHVCLPTTCTRLKYSGLTSGAVSPQITYPSEPGCLPKQIENILSSNVSTIVVFARVARATPLMPASDSTRPAGTGSPALVKLDMISCTILKRSSISARGASDGPRPMMAWNSEWASAGMLASVTSQKDWFLGA